jgi:peptide/nickel transport system substrate-binding protein
MKQPAFLARAIFAAILATPLLGAAGSRPAAAQTLRVGVQAPFVVDPHLLFFGPNMAAARHIFDSLVGRDADSRWTPSLAESWKQLDDTTWEFKLRKGVAFQDGSPFTADDVVATFKRIPSIPNNPGPYTPNLRTVGKVEVVDPYTIHVHTTQPNPTLPGQFTNIFIISKNLANTLGEAGSSKIAMGTGPYKLTGFTNGEGMTLERNESYWGKKPAYKNVTVKVITNNAAREAALLSGDIDLMENVPPDDVAGLKANPKTTVYSRPADRVVFLLPNVGADRLAAFTDASGKPLDVNPMRDARVREALSLAVDRNALVQRVLSGQGEPTNQLVPDGFTGWIKDFAVPKADPQRARKLLAEAGYPNGFHMSIVCTNDRYILDGRMCQALAQMFSRVGLTTNVDAIPGSMFMPRTKPGKNDESVMMYAISLSSLRDVAYILSLESHSLDEKRGYGDGNRGGYSDPALDKMIEDAGKLTGPARDTALQGVQREAVKRLGIIPLYIEPTIAGARSDVLYTPRMDQQLVATGASPKP